MTHVNHGRECVQPDHCRNPLATLRRTLATPSSACWSMLSIQCFTFAIDSCGERRWRAVRRAQPLSEGARPGQRRQGQGWVLLAAAPLGRLACSGGAAALLMFSQESVREGAPMKLGGD